MAFTSIDDPSAYFQTLLYTGNASARSLTNDGNSNLQPDWVWTKKRNEAQNHCVTDSTRGVGNILFPDVNDAESATQLLTSFDSDGFSINNNALVNDNSDTYVAWQWKANGGTTSSNTSGTITSTVQANTTAGFSIVTYTGNNTDGATFGHGLGAVPHFITIKKRGNAGNWMTYHQNLGEDKAVFLDLANATESSSFYQETPTSTLVTLNNHGNVNANSETYVAYCFSEIQGFSKFGGYTGNGDNDGTFQFTGFQPAWLMIKRTDSSTNGNWWIHDTKRDVFNVGSRTLKADTNATEVNSSDQYVDLFSNGFKLRNGNNSQNGSGATYIYAAFAGRPMVTSTGTPTTGGVIKLT